MRSRTCAMLISFVSLVAIPAASTRASAADPGTGSAKDHFDKGTVLYNSGSFAQAAAEYDQAYTQDPKPAYLWALAQSNRQADKCEDAIPQYRGFARIATSDSAVSAANTAIQQCNLRLMEKDQQKKKQQEEERKAAETTPEAKAPPPKGAAETPAAKAAPPSPSVSHWYADPLGYVLTVGGLAAAGVGTFLLVSGNSSATDANSSATLVGYTQSGSSAHQQQPWGVVGIAAGGTLVALGVWRFIAVASRGGAAHVTTGHQDEPLTVSGYVAPGGGAATVTYRF